MSGFSGFFCIRSCFLFCPFLSSWKLTRAGGQDAGCRLLGSLQRRDSKDANLEFLGGCKLGGHLIYFSDYLNILYTVLVRLRKHSLRM